MHAAVLILTTIYPGATLLEESPSWPGASSHVGAPRNMEEERGRGEEVGGVGWSRGGGGAGGGVDVGVSGSSEEAACFSFTSAALTAAHLHQRGNVFAQQLAPSKEPQTG